LFDRILGCLRDDTLLTTELFLWINPYCRAWDANTFIGNGGRCPPKELRSTCPSGQDQQTNSAGLASHLTLPFCERSHQTRGSMAASTSRRRPKKMCPVCGSASLKKNSLSIEVDHRNPPDFQSYKCDKGHVFFIEKAKAATEAHS